MTLNKRVGRVKPHGDGEAGRDATHTDVTVKRALVDPPITPEKRDCARFIGKSSRVIRDLVRIERYQSKGVIVVSEKFLNEIFWK